MRSSYDRPMETKNNISFCEQLVQDSEFLRECEDLEGNPTCLTDNIVQLLNEIVMDKQELSTDNLVIVLNTAHFLLCEELYDRCIEFANILFATSEDEELLTTIACGIRGKCNLTDRRVNPCLALQVWLDPDNASTLLEGLGGNGIYSEGLESEIARR